MLINLYDSLNPDIRHFDILKAVNFPWPIARIIVQHHERIDGSGYPIGLKEDELLLESRILAVADACLLIFNEQNFKFEQ